MKINGLFPIGSILVIHHALLTSWRGNDSEGIIPWRRLTRGSAPCLDDEWIAHEVKWDNDDASRTILEETDDEATNYVSHWEVVAQDQGGKWIRDPPLPQSVTGAETLIALIDILCEHPIASELFDRPVSLKDCPNYTDSGGIAQPMDLTLIRARLLSGYYRSLDSVLSDVDLIARNAHIYNDEELSSIPVFCGSGVLCYEPAHRAIAASELG